MRFDISDVAPATDPLPEIPYALAVQAQLVPSQDTLSRESIRQRYRGLPFEPPTHKSIEACSGYHGTLLENVGYHPVVAAIHIAFDLHRPLSLSPDAIWLMICQAVANHINVQGERLRPLLVRHTGRLELSVRRDDFIKGSPDNPWPEVFDALQAKIREHVGPAIDLFLPAFTTTGPVERAAAGVVLLDAMQSFFEYSVQSLCGIPSITLKGTTEDWQALATRAEEFSEYGMAPWIEHLRPILNQFIRASRGDIDLPFWKSIYKLDAMSGGPLLSGWIAVFFPYLKNRRTGKTSIQMESYFGKAHAIDDLLYPYGKRANPDVWAGLSIEMLPGGISKAPFKWEFPDGAIDMDFLGGFVGVSQDGGTLRPEIGWAVREADKRPKDTRFELAWIPTEGNPANRIPF